MFDVVTCDRALESKISEVFFRETCLVDECISEEVVLYTDFLTSQLRFESIVLTECSLMGLFVLLQLGGIPNPRDHDCRFNLLGLIVWCFWMGFVVLQFLFTALSLLMTILASFAAAHQYQNCFVDIDGGLGAAGGAAIGSGVGLVAGLAIHMYFLKYTKRCRLGAVLLALIFYAAPMLAGSAIGAAWGAATTGSAFFVVAMPALLCHPVFISKSAALLAYVYTFSLGLVAAQFRVNPDRIIRIYTYITVAPFVFTGIFFWLFSGAIIFSVLFVPVSLAIGAVCVGIFWAIRILRQKSHHDATDDALDYGDENGREMAPLKDVAPRVSDVEGADSTRSARGTPLDAQSLDRPPVRAPRRQQKEQGKRADLEIEDLDFLGDEDFDDKGAMVQLLKREIQTLVANSELDEEALSGMLVDLAREWVLRHGSGFVISESPPPPRRRFLSSRSSLEEELTGGITCGRGGVRFDPLGIFRGAVWWLPQDIIAAAKKQLVYDFDFDFRTEGNISMFRIVLYTTVLTVLSPMVVFSAWVAVFSYLGRGTEQNFGYIRQLYRHFFGVFFDWSFRPPTLWDWNLLLVEDWEPALKHLPIFLSVEPFVQLNGSQVYAALSLCAALLKPLASLVGSVLAAAGCVCRNEKIGDVAKANADFLAVFETHPDGASHSVLVSRLEQLGLKDLAYVLDKTDSFAQFDVHSHVFSVPSSVFGGFKGLVVLNIADCRLVRGSLQELSACSALRQLNLWNCERVSGKVTNQVLQWLAAIPQKHLFACGPFEVDSGFAAFTQSSLDLGTMSTLSASLETLELCASVEGINLLGCAGVQGFDVFVRVPFAASLRHLVLSGTAITGLECLAPLASLTDLACDHCLQLEGSLEVLAGLTGLNALSLRQCRGVRCEVTEAVCAWLARIRNKDTTGCGPFVPSAAICGAYADGDGGGDGGGTGGGTGTGTGADRARDDGMVHGGDAWLQNAIRLREIDRVMNPHKPRCARCTAPSRPRSDLPCNSIRSLAPFEIALSFARHQKLLFVRAVRSRR